YPNFSPHFYSNIALGDVLLQFTEEEVKFEDTILRGKKTTVCIHIHGLQMTV
ncbi:hypothetical protein AVEN_274327-1, partial [Araneus ventricosus]